MKSRKERIIQEVQEELKTFCVPVVATYSGHVTVEASCPEDAIKKAEENWKGIESIESYSFGFDFTDDPEEVLEAEDDGEEE